MKRKTITIEVSDYVANQILSAKKQGTVVQLWLDVIESWPSGVFVRNGGWVSLARKKRAAKTSGKS